MQHIGITGGIGSGKSTIAKELAKRGWTVYDCDREAKRIIEQESDVRQAIIDLLGYEAFLQSCSPALHHYNTAYVAKRVFANPELLHQLNAIVHPAVKRDIAQRNEPLLIESAILFEAGLDTLCKKVIIVDAPEEVRIARTIARDYQGVDTEENINKVRARMQAQNISYPPSADCLVVNNDGQTPILALADEIEDWL